MSSSIYGKLAVTSIKSNHKTYVPYILTSILTVMMYFIMDSLAVNDSIGEGKVSQILEFVVNVIILFSVIFLFYTNSFLIKRRKKEIGIYNILGMGKGHIAKMLTLETLMIAGISIVAGLLFGILLSKLMWLLLLNLINYDVRMEFMVPRDTIVRTLMLFGAIFGATLIYNLMQIKLANPVELLRGGNQGEKEPRTRYLLTIFGVVMVGIGYYIALSTESPLAAVQKFFVAVIAVILGTYALFTTGSIALLKALRKNKGFYYQSKHFTAVSGMIYRMKQNAVGLANICILSTMVLILVSTSISMYLGTEDMLKTGYPEEIAITQKIADDAGERRLDEIVSEVTKENHVKIKNETRTHYGEGVAARDGRKFLLETAGNFTDISACEICMIPQEDYIEMTGDKISLAEDEVLFYTTSREMYGMDTIQIEDKTYHVVKELEDMWTEPKSDNRIVQAYYVVFSGMGEVEKWNQFIYDTSDMKEEWKQEKCQIRYKLTFDLDGQEEDRIAAAEEIQEKLEKEALNVSYDSRELEREAFYGLYGGLFFIGVYLGAMFLMATVLIIYYKQISEGYDDRERYQIMQKVGMSNREVRRSIKSQVLTVFFLPLVTAIIHVAVAFTVVKKLLAVLYLVNVPLFFRCTVATIAVFAVFYGIVFAVTAKEYYRIVN